MNNTVENDEIKQLERSLKNYFNLFEQLTAPPRDPHMLEKLVVCVRGVKIEIYSDEHAPPHFHVVHNSEKSSFDIENGNHIEGDLKRKDQKVVQAWHSKNKETLKKVWNDTRPTGCPVGKIP
ncbi:DUF4160 domain-containing protein [Desulfuromonas sp. AOP6]|uniref:DUF4160 domain-containing protein n=1 Tax=Desulfuromonas sp. AOP6 TaxID=1566351 RepID=UPI001270667C|nr:DUF4160 domain-containing protein [Desulfuromonas sp. AOP6]BCA79061.1 hypothetical protein AOP6_0848 [Desulfuromonas sp. AOP6]